ncbi:MAG TPA: M23 family metallopeptidase [Nocardioides sp.]|uniref:M23 family metallopeptidase n=1 Tax=Nocardioides sp. TaxID=35761 RepID=UPI002C103B80|nr:M23 family metallopeptidase [Nocardioides sp.]HQR28288.1 M23 family metallopeptidase [Nocardioides sp.]
MLRTLLVAILVAVLLAFAHPVAHAVATSTGDPRWVFYTKDTTRYSSTWYAGKHRKMVPFGCTRAPYYDPDPRCTKGRGFHHGLDLAMRCGTRLFAGRNGWVVSNDALGPAYGENPLLIRNYRVGRDFLLAHTRTVFVEPGDRVTRGMLVARASDSGAPDGCHLHFEVRTAAGGLDTAMRPLAYLDLST